MLYNLASILRLFWEQTKEYFLKKLDVHGTAAISKKAASTEVIEWTRFGLRSTEGVQFGGGSSTVRGYTQGMYIDASATANAKWYQRNDTSYPVQINKGTKVYVPVTASGTISILCYYAEGSIVNNDGATVIKNGSSYVIKFDDSNVVYINNVKYVCFEAAENDYIQSITYTYKEDYVLRVDGKGVHINGDLTVTGSMAKDDFKVVYDAEQITEHGFYHCPATSDNLPAHDGDMSDIAYNIQCIRYSGSAYGILIAYPCSHNATEYTIQVKRFSKDAGGNVSYGSWYTLVERT